MTLERLCSVTRKGLDDFNMLREGEKVAVGVSGGKDSLALVTALAKIAAYHPKRFRSSPSPSTSASRAPIFPR